MNQRPDPSIHRSLLNRRQIQHGEAVQIKGDEEAIRQLEETVQALMAKKLRQAEQQAKLMLEAAKTKARQEADKILAEAQMQAESLVAEATDQRDSIRDQAQQEGFDVGFAQGHQEATAQVEQETVKLLESAQTLMNGAYQAEQFVLSRFQNDALKLVRYVIERVLRQEMQTAPEAVAQLITQAVNALYMSGRVKVVMGEEIQALIRSYTEGTKSALEQLSRLELMGDPQLSHHEIFVLSSEGSFDVSPMTQVDQLLAPMVGQLPLTSPESVVSPVSSGQPVASGHETSAGLDAALFDFADQEALSLDSSSSPEEAVEMDSLEGMEDTEVSESVLSDAMPSGATPFVFEDISDLVSESGLEPPEEEG